MKEVLEEILDELRKGFSITGILAALGLIYLVCQITSFILNILF